MLGLGLGHKINSWERDNISWSRVHFVKVTASFSRGHPTITYF